MVRKFLRLSTFGKTSHRTDVVIKFIYTTDDRLQCRGNVFLEEYVILRDTFMNLYLCGLMEFFSHTKAESPVPESDGKKPRDVCINCKINMFKLLFKF